MKKIKLLIILFLLFFITGCTSYTELNDLGIVSILGIDYQQDQYQISVTILEGDQDDGILDKKYITYQASASTLEQAFQNITIQSDKKLYLSHVDVLLVTENLIDYRLQDTLLNFLNNNEYRNNFNIVFVKSNYQDFFDNQVTAEEINKLITINNQESGTINEVDFETFLRNLLIDSNAYLPMISYQDKRLKADGFLLIKDYQTYEELSSSDSILFNLMNNHIHRAIWNNITIYENETSIKTSLNQITIHLKITTDQEPARIEKELAQAIKKLFIYYQEKDYDLLKLQNKIRQNDFKYYQKTNNLLKEINLKVIVDGKKKNKYIEGGLS